MKWAVGVLVFIWLLCGIVGAWRLDELNADHWKAIGKGSITLAKAFNDDPVNYPGPD